MCTHSYALQLAPAVPHMMANAFRNLVCLALETDIDFKEVLSSPTTLFVHLSLHIAPVHCCQFCIFKCPSARSACTMYCPAKTCIYQSISICITWRSLCHS